MTQSRINLVEDKKFAKARKSWLKMQRETERRKREMREKLEKP